MNLRHLRRLTLSAAITMLSVTALIGILALLSASLDGVAGRVLATTSTIGVASVLCLCYLAPIGRRGWWVGVLGAAVLAIPVVCLLMIIWMPDAGGDWLDTLHKPLLVGIDGALTLAQISMLVGAARDRLRGLLAGTVLLAVVLALMIAVPFLTDRVPSLFSARLYGVVGILDALGTIVLLILARFGGRPDTATVLLPSDLVSQVDELVGATKRAAYVTEAVAMRVERDRSAGVRG